MKLTNYTIGQYLTLPEVIRRQCDIVLKSINPPEILLKVKGRFRKHPPKHADIWDFMYSEIIDLKTAFADSPGTFTTEIGRVGYGLDEKEILQISFLCLAKGLFLSFVEKFTKMLEVEDNELRYEPTAKERAAGVENLARFGHLPAIKAVAKSLNISEGEVLSLPYHRVFQELVYLSTVNEIERKMIENAGK